MSVRVRAGRMRERVVIEVNTPVDNSVGEPIESWATLDTVWAEVETMDASETFKAGAERGTAPVIFRIRHRTDVSETNRLTWDGDTYDIDPPQNVDGADKLLEITGVRRA